MTTKDLLKDSRFEEVGEVRADSKNRITLGRTGSAKVFSYKVYRNSIGQTILDPQVTISAHEAWLFKNREAQLEVQKGLADAKRGRLVKAKENYSKHIDNPA